MEQVLLGALASLAILSGALKVRTRVRQLVGGAAQGLLELLAGVALILALGPNMASDGVRVSLASITAVVMAVSNVHAIRRAWIVSRGRRASEEQRLYMQVKLARAMEGKPLDEEPREDL